MEQEIHRIWILVSELSEQLAQNNRVAADLHNQINTLKEQANTSAKASLLRRYNTDISKELFDSDLERSTVAVILENQALLQENKQSTSLMTDYEHTVETVMTKFRQHAQASSEKEMAVLRHYETLLINREGQPLTQTYNLNILNQTLHQLQAFIRLAMKNNAARGDSPADQYPDGPESELEAMARALERVELDNADASGETKSDDDPDGAFDWAYERELEIARLEKENEELRRNLSIYDNPDTAGSDPDLVRTPASSAGHSRSSSNFGSGFTTSGNQHQHLHQQPSQPSPMGGGPFGGPAFGGGAQGYTPPPNFLTQQQTDRRFMLPNRNSPVGPAPPQITPRNMFADNPGAGSSSGSGSGLGSGPGLGRGQPPLPNFFRNQGGNRERIDLAGGQPPLL